MYIDDIDLQRITFTKAADYALADDREAFVKAADGGYTAYVYVNAGNNTAKSMTISLKRFKLN